MTRSNPVQVILKSEQYKNIPEKMGGGSNTDFYADRDEDFKRHKNKLISEADHVQEQLMSSGYSVGLVKVELNSQALAKSHRPVISLFPSDKAPNNGGFV